MPGPEVLAPFWYVVFILHTRVPKVDYLFLATLARLDYLILASSGTLARFVARHLRLV